MFYLANTEDNDWYTNAVFRTYARARSFCDDYLEPFKYSSYAEASTDARGGRFYAVRLGRKIGVFTDHQQARAQIHQYSGAQWKGFDYFNEAKQYMDADSDDEFDSDECVYYAVRSTDYGDTGIWTDWDELVDRAGDPDYDDDIEWEGFTSLADAYLYLRGGDSSWKIYAGPLDQDPGPDTNHIYVDGCCLNNGRRKSKGGFGFYWPQLKDSEWYGKVHRPSSNRAELVAILAALQEIEKREFYDDEHIIYSDSNYAINCVSDWGDNWDENGWYTSNGHPVHNAELIQEVRAKWDELVEDHGFIICLEKVKGHAGIKGNEIADRLAKMGALS